MKITHRVCITSDFCECIKDHSRLHIIAKLVNNNVDVIKDNWIGLRGKNASQKLTLKYELKEASSKNLSLISFEALNEKEATKFIIDQAIIESLQICKNLDDIKERLVKKR